MKNTPLNKFVEQVMKIDAGYAGMGGAVAGILGATGTPGQIVTDLRTHAIAFATEYVKRPPNRKKLTDLARQLEASLYSIKLVNGISDERLEELTSELQALLDDHKLS
jgi:hypothetical protein